MLAQSKTILKEKKGTGKSTFTSVQAHFIRAKIMNDLANGKFKKTEEMKTKIIQYAIEFHKENECNSKFVQKLAKSTFYDFLNDYCIPTPNQYKKTKNDLSYPIEVIEPDCGDVKDNGLLAQVNFEASTDITSTSQVNQNGYDDQMSHYTCEIEIFEDSSSATENTNVTTQPMQFTPVLERVQLPEEPSNNFSSGLFSQQNEQVSQFENELPPLKLTKEESGYSFLKNFAQKYEEESQGTDKNDPFIGDQHDWSSQESNLFARSDECDVGAFISYQEQNQSIPLVPFDQEIKFDY